MGERGGRLLLKLVETLLLPLLILEHEKRLAYTGLEEQFASAGSL